MTVRWVRDSKKYNEWMNEIDYETEEGQAEQESKANPGLLLCLHCLLESWCNFPADVA